MIVIMMASSAADVYAQKNVIGTSWSFSGIGITYERHMDDGTFARIGVQTEMTDAFLGHCTKAGASASFTWNIVFASITSRNDIEVRFYAGPGVAIGYNSDREVPYGAFFGLKGRLGARCSYSRNIDIEVGIAPVLGLHRHNIENDTIMSLYRQGLIQILMPEIVIAYRF